MAAVTSTQGWRSFSVRGTIVMTICAMVIGILAQLSTMFFDSELQVVWALALMILTLLLRPQGILGKRERVG